MGKPRFSFLLIAAFAGIFSLARAETVFETFDVSPESTGWWRVGEEAGFDHVAEGWLRTHLFSSSTDQRFLLPLSETYDQTQEFWFEFDWRPEAVYEWPRANIGVMRGAAMENRDTIGVSFQRRLYAQGEEGQRGIGVASDGTSTNFSTPNFPRPSGSILDARTAVHYRQNEAGEGWLTVTIKNLASGEILATASGRVLAAGKTATFDHLGFSSFVAASSSPQYADRMRFDNLYFSTEAPADEWFQSRGELRPAPSWIEDFSPPEPNPLVWDQVPEAIRATQITMSAGVATDDRYPVEYYFENVDHPERNSGWQAGRTWTDRDLLPEATYHYRVKARDMSPNRNETEWSVTAAAATPAETDFSPPEPNPMAWETEPYLVTANRIAMVAAEASDPEGNEPVEYYFSNLTDPSRDSGWQTERTFIDSGLLYETTYEYAVKARDRSANQNETAFSLPVSVTTSIEPELTEFLRTDGLWQGESFGEPVAFSIYHADPASAGERLHTAVYVRNSGLPRIGTEPDASILQDLIDDGFLVIVLDFAMVPELPPFKLERALLEFHQSLPETDPKSVFFETGFLPDLSYIYFLPAGYRLARNLPFWNVRDHGWEGTMTRIMNTYNGHVVANFDVDPVTNPADMRGPDGEEIDYNLYLDIIYPSQPIDPVPVLIDSSTNLPRMRMFGPDNDRMIYPISFAFGGYAWVSMDHCWNPLARAEYYGYWDQYSLDDWNGLASGSAAVRFLRAHAEEHGLREESIGIMGHSKGAYAATRLADPDHESAGEHFTFSGFPRTTPEPQPWPGFSSQVSVTFQSMGNGTRRLQYVTERNVPTVIAVGRFDEYNQWQVFPELVARYVDQDLNHLALWMTDLNHTYPWADDELYGEDRFELVRKFFDGYLRPRNEEGPEVLYVLPKNDSENIHLWGRIRQLPPTEMLPEHAEEELEPMGKIAVHFSPAIDPESVASGGLQVVRVKDGEPVPGKWEAARQNTFFRFDPAEPLEDYTQYEIRIGHQIRDLKGNSLKEERVSRFRTGAVSAAYEEWIEQQALPPEKRGAFLDPHGTGIRNLLAYALDLEPTSPDRTRFPRPVLQSFAGGRTIDFSFAAPRRELIYQVERSTDLQSWAPVSLTESNFNGRFLRASVSAEETSTLFMRLKILPSPFP